jgi:hypothetical protein
MTEPLDRLSETLGTLLATPPYALEQSLKQELLAPALGELTVYHKRHCDFYRNILQALPPLKHEGLAGLPFIPVQLFKQLDLYSISQDQTFKILTSSGTTGQIPSKIFLDRTTAQLQTKVLVKIMQDFIGKNRLPMLIVDHPNVVRDRSSFSARGAGILGMLTFGREPTYLLDEDMKINFAELEQFLAKYSTMPVLLFGFTFMVWQHLLEELAKLGKWLELPTGILIHSGGWKKLQDQAIDNATFKNRLYDLTGISQCHNFYGMVEQVGSIFVECKHGVLHAPNFAEIIVRSAIDWSECAVGEAGLIEVLSLLPHSYPGHILLTEDRGRILGTDDCPCGRKGRYFEVLGRIPKAELRGCSDSHAAQRSMP